MLTYFRINYLTNLTYFPIFPHYVNFSKVAAASPLTAAAAAAAAAAHTSIIIKYLFVRSTAVAGILKNTQSKEELEK